jgi:hypothetical protein
MRRKKKPVYEKNTLIDGDVESDLSLILIQYLLSLFDHPKIKIIDFICNFDQINFVKLFDMMC